MKSRASLLFSLLLTGLAWAGPRLEPLAGTGKAGFSGDGGPALKAEINNPFGLVRGPDGALYFCDTMNHAVRRIDAKGVITTVAGTGKMGCAGDGGPAVKALLNEPYEVRFNRAGDLYFVERMNHDIRRVDAKTGVITTVAGNGKDGFSGDGGPADKAQLRQPHSIQFDAADNLFICDLLNHRVRRIDAGTGVIGTVCGTGKKGSPADGAAISPATPLAGPRAMDFAPDGTLWLALREGNAVYRLDLKEGKLHHVITKDLHGPKGLSLAPDGRIYLADTESHSITWFNPADAAPAVKTLVGDGKKGLLARPHGVFVDKDGSVLIGDSENHRVWRVEPK